MATCEILTIGTELLLGQILNTNVQYLCRELANLGIDCLWQTTVGDNKTRIKQALQDAFNRCDLVITTGGLGPTADDLTHECIAEFFQCPMQFDEQIMQHIEQLFKSRNYPMAQSNRKQALRPEGAMLLPNPVGTAPGIIWQVPVDQLKKAGITESQRSRCVITFPGVPSEMHAMWRNTARQFLQDHYAGGMIYSRELKHYGIGESVLAETVSDLLNLQNPTVAPLAGRGECRLRVTAKAESEEKAMAMVQPVVQEIKKRSGTFCYGENEDTLEAVVGKLLKQRKMTVSFAESCTGGLASKRLTDVPGSSAYTKLNVVTYANEAKQDFLGVHEYILKTKGAVSAECAHAMATGVRRLAKADLGVGITGIAGPDGGTPDKPVGLVYLALVAEHHQVDKTLHFPETASRSEIRERTASEALNMVRLFLLEAQ